MALYVNLMLLFGLPLFALYAFRGTSGRGTTVLSLRPLAVVLSVSAVLISGLSFVSMTASMAGVPLAEVGRATLASMLFETSMGTAWQVRVAALFIALFAAAMVGRGKHSAWISCVALATGTALATLAWTGHGAASEGVMGNVHVAADIVHLLAAGAWMGAIAALIVMVSKRSPTAEYLQLTYRALHDFSIVGTVIVALIVISGLFNSWMLVGPGNLISAPATLYGQLLLVKLSFFAAMLALAASNRFRLTPTFEHAITVGDARMAIRSLRRSLMVEAAAAAAILALVAWLGTLQPPMSM